jgi:hypothetical protein
MHTLYNRNHPCYASAVGFVRDVGVMPGDIILHVANAAFPEDEVVYVLGVLPQIDSEDTGMYACHVITGSGQIYPAKPPVRKRSNWWYVEQSAIVIYRDLYGDMYACRDITA